MGVYPMRLGGYTAAASGLVNVAPREVASAPERATRLDYAESYLRAREAVKSLNASLKENGRSFSVSTKKGQENRSALYSSIRAAQDAARTKFEETGSVKAANAAEIFSMPNVDGGLIGGASLKAEEFLAIVAAART